MVISDSNMRVYRGPFHFEEHPHKDYYNQFSSQERNVGTDIHVGGPSMKGADDTAFWWEFAAISTGVCFLILLFILGLQLLTRVILRHNQVNQLLCNKGLT